MVGGGGMHGWWGRDARLVGEGCTVGGGGMHGWWGRDAWLVGEESFSGHCQHICGSAHGDMLLGETGRRKDVMSGRHLECPGDPG